MKVTGKLAQNQKRSGRSSGEMAAPRLRFGLAARATKAGFECLSASQALKT